MKKKLYMGLLIAFIPIISLFIMYDFYTVIGYGLTLSSMSKYADDYWARFEYTLYVYDFIYSFIRLILVAALLAMAICLLVCVCKNVKPSRGMKLAFAIIIIVLNSLLIISHCYHFYYIKMWYGERIASVAGAFDIIANITRILFNALVIVGSSFWIYNIQTDYLKLTPEERAQKKAEEAEIRKRAEIEKLQARLNELQNGDNSAN